MRIVLASALLVWLWCAPAFAACTDGVDCYCDRVDGGDLNDTLLLMCEDFENPGYYSGSPNFAASTGSLRGEISAWALTHQNGVGSALWSPGDPTGTPYVGPQCATAQQVCVGLKEYCSAAQGTEVGVTGDGGGVNCWGSASFDANDLAYADMQKTANLDYKAEITDLAGPTTELANGQQHLAYRIPEGQGRTSGLVGVHPFTSSDTIGITIAMALPSNIEDSNILTLPWKFDEWENVSGSGLKYNMFPFGNSLCVDEPASGNMANEFPFCPFFGTQQSSCSTAGATQTVGSIACNSTVAWYLFADGALWDPQTDLLPHLDNWICARFFIENYMISSTRARLWVTTPDIDDRLIIDISTWDTTQGRGEFNEYVFGSYSNYNDDTINNPTGPWSTETTYRHEDNIHIRAGLPVTCAQIGFGAGAAATASMAGGSITGGSAN